MTVKGDPSDGKGIGDGGRDGFQDTDEMQTVVVDDDGDDCGVVLFYLWVLDDAGDNALQSYIKLY